MAIADEVSRGGLEWHRNAVVRAIAYCAQSVDQAIGSNQEAQPQTRSEQFAERADVNHATVAAIKRLECRGRRTFVAKFAVVIVFKDERIGLIGPLQQRETTRQTHGDAHRVLMRGRHHCEPCVGSTIPSIINIQTFGIDTDTYRRSPG